jgi:hypothetical protein
MLRATIAVIAVLLTAATSTFAEETVEVRRVLVIDKSIKPAAAASQPKYEYVKVKTAEGKTNPELLCDACCKKEGFKEYVSKPALQGKTIAFLCASCGEICYRENGVEVKHTEEAEVKALKHIETELRNPIDKTQKPTIQNLQQRGRQ